MMDKKNFSKKIKSLEDVFENTTFLEMSTIIGIFIGCSLKSMSDDTRIPPHLLRDKSLEIISVTSKDILGILEEGDSNVGIEI